MTQNPYETQGGYAGQPGYAAQPGYPQSPSQQATPPATPGYPTASPYSAQSFGPVAGHPTLPSAGSGGGFKDLFDLSLGGKATPLTKLVQVLTIVACSLNVLAALTSAIASTIYSGGEGSIYGLVGFMVSIAVSLVVIGLVRLAVQLSVTTTSSAAALERIVAKLDERA